MERNDNAPNFCMSNQKIYHVLSYSHSIGFLCLYLCPDILLMFLHQKKFELGVGGRFIK